MVVYLEETFTDTTSGDLGTNNLDVDESGGAWVGCSGSTGVWDYASDGSGVRCTVAGLNNGASHQTDGREDVRGTWDIVLSRGAADDNWQGVIFRHTGGAHWNQTMSARFEGPGTGADDLVLYDANTAIHTWDISTTSPADGDTVRIIIDCEGDDITLVSLQKNGGAVDTYDSTYTLTGSTATNHGAGSGADYYGIRSQEGATGTGERFEFFRIESIPAGGGAQTWTGTGASVDVTATTGSFTPSAVTWAGTGASVDVTATTGSFTPAAVTWAGTTAAVDVTATTGSFTPAAVTWAGTGAAVDVTPTSGSFSTGGAPQTWTGTTAAVNITPTSGTFTPAAVTWAGTGAAVDVTPTSGSFFTGAVWAGTAATVNITPTSGTFTPAAVTWTATTATVDIAPNSGSFLSGSVWVGTAATVNIDPAAGSFTPAAVTWTGTGASVNIAPSSGAFIADQVWAGTTAAIDITAANGVWNIPDQAGHVTLTTDSADVGLALTAASVAVSMSQG